MDDRGRHGFASGSIQGIGSSAPRLKRSRSRFSKAGLARPAFAGFSPTDALEAESGTCAIAAFSDNRSVPLGPPLRQTFFARDARAVAADLVGCRLVHRLDSGERLVVRIVEVEAYLGDGLDPASHAHRGPTPRNRAMFGPAGRLYAYRSYGIHTCVNVVCDVSGGGSAVLLRAAEPIEGLSHMRGLRGLPAEAPATLIARGPGRLAQALGLGLEHDGQSLLRPPLTLHAPSSSTGPVRVSRGPRVGISKAASRPDRFFEADSPWVSTFRAGGGKTRSR